MSSADGRPHEPLGTKGIVTLAAVAVSALGVSMLVLISAAGKISAALAETNPLGPLMLLAATAGFALLGLILAYGASAALVQDARLRAGAR